MKHVLKLTAEHIDRIVAGERITIEDVDLYLEKKQYEATGAEIKEFYTTGWDSDYYYESEDASVQIEDEFGQWIAQDSRVYNLRDLGTLGWQGSGDPKSKGKPGWWTFEEAFLKWKNAKA